MIHAILIVVHLYITLIYNQEGLIRKASFKFKAYKDETVMSLQLSKSREKLMTASSPLKNQLYSNETHICNKRRTKIWSFRWQV